MRVFDGGALADGETIGFAWPTTDIMFKARSGGDQPPSLGHVLPDTPN